MDQKLKIGVLGAGHLGKIHLRLLQESSAYELVGFYDSQPQIAAKISREFGYRSFSDVNSLFDEVDVIDIVTPTLSHFELAKKALESGLHVFLEKPITATVKEADELVSLAKAKGLLGMVGQVERFNPAFMAANSHIQKPMFIEAHRLAEFNPRGTDVSVILDLMIHDIGIAMALVAPPLTSVEAIGVRVLSQTEDIANARLLFENGCVANLSASRVSEKKAREIRVFQDSGYLSLDFMNQKGHLIEKNGFELNKSEVPVRKGEPLALEIESFLNCVKQATTPKTDGNFGKSALEIALSITRKIESSW